MDYEEIVIFKYVGEKEKKVHRCGVEHTLKKGDFFKCSRKDFEKNFPEKEEDEEVIFPGIS